MHRPPHVVPLSGNDRQLRSSHTALATCSLPPCLPRRSAEAPSQQEEMIPFGFSSNRRAQLALPAFPSLPSLHALLYTLAIHPTTLLPLPELTPAGTTYKPSESASMERSEQRGQHQGGGRCDHSQGSVGKRKRVRTRKGADVSDGDNRGLALEQGGGGLHARARQISPHLQTQLASDESTACLPSQPSQPRRRRTWRRPTRASGPRRPRQSAQASRVSAQV